MKNWKECKVGEICNINKNSYSKNDNYCFVNYLDTGNLTENTISEIQRIDLSIEELPSRAKRKVTDKSILYSTVRPNQKHFGIIKNIPKNFLVSTGFAVIDTIESKADPYFLYYYLSRDEITTTLHAIAEQSTSAYPAIKPTDIMDLTITLPPLSTQKKIAAVLSALDDKIELNRQINANLEQQAQALFKSWFVDNDRIVCLGSVIETTSGGTPSRKDESLYENGTICWVKSKELAGSFITDSEEKINEKALEKSSAKLIPANSVMIAMYGATVGEYGIIQKEMACNQAICAILENENYPFTYLFMLVKNEKQNLINMAIGSAQQNINQVIIKDIKVHSDLDKIGNYHNTVKPLFDKMLELSIENKTLAAIRDTLLPKLMSGELQV